DPRHSALPDPRDQHRRHGVYYHVNFHDLQASNQLAMLQAPDLIARELARAVSRGADDLLIVNSGNVRPHVLPLELVMELARRVPKPGAEKALADKVCRDFARRHFGAARVAEEAYRRYFRSPWRTSRHPDARAGEELYHHASRAIASACLARRTEEACPELLWARAGTDFRAQLRWFRRRAAAGRRAWDGLLRDVERVEAELARKAGGRFFRDNLGMQTRFHRESNLGLLHTCDGARAFADSDLLAAFLTFTRAIRCFERAHAALVETEHGKWKGFFRGDWLTGTASTVRKLRLLRSYARAVGDPSDSVWRRRSMPAGEARVRLAYIWRRPIDDDALAEFLSRPGSFVPERIIRLADPR
ncbi:MAG: glycosyl hydrolase 115 family protein, partial [Planctomycetota bacterium]